MNTGVIHLEIGNYDLALDYFKESKESYEKAGAENRLDNIWFNTARANFGKGNYNDALSNNQKSLKIYQSKNDYFGIGLHYILKARIFQKINQIDSALFYVKEGLRLHQSIGSKSEVQHDRILLANILFTKDVNHATEIAEEVLNETSGFRDHGLKVDFYDLLHRCYKEKGKHFIALTMLEKHNAYADSLLIQNDQVAVAKKVVESEYETRIFNAKLKNEQSQATLKIKQIRNTFILCCIGAAAILFSFFFFRYKKTLLNKQKEVLKDEVSHLKKLNVVRNQLIQSDKMASLGQLTAGVAHEINNPINFISSGVIGLKSSLDEYINNPRDEKSSKLIGDMNDMIVAIEEGAKRTRNIAKSLRLFSCEDTENYKESDIIIGLESTFTLLANRFKEGIIVEKAVSYTHLTLPTNREV